MTERLAELTRAFEAAIAGDSATWREALGRARWDDELAAFVTLAERVLEDLDAFRRDRDHVESKERLAAAGALAGAMATSLAAPLARVREALGQTCDLLDKHVALSKGGPSTRSGGLLTSALKNSFDACTAEAAVSEVLANVSIVVFSDDWKFAAVSAAVAPMVN